MPTRDATPEHASSGWERFERERAGFRSPAERAWYGVVAPRAYDEERRARDRALKDALDAVAEQPDDDWPDAAPLPRRAVAFAVDVALVAPLIALAGIWWALGLWFAYVWVTNALGRSAGKLVVGIRVINDDKQRPGLVRGLVRTWLSVVDACFLAAVPALAAVLVAVIATTAHIVPPLLAGASAAAVLGAVLIPRWVDDSGTIHDTLSMTEVVRAR